MIGTICPAVNDLTYVKGGVESVPVPGKVTVIEFWATWCPPCRTAIPHLSEMAKAHPDAVFVGITDEDEGKAAPFVKGMGDKMAYHVAIDEGGSGADLRKKCGARGIPFAVLVDKHGKIVFTGHPMEPSFEEALEKAVKERVADNTKYTEEQLNEMKPKQLKELIASRGLSSEGLPEKSDLVKFILSHQ